VKLHLPVVRQATIFLLDFLIGKFNWDFIFNWDFSKPGLNSEFILILRPSLSDQIKVGFYSSDRFAQTTVTEILDLKNATNDLDYLCKEINIVKTDLKFAKNSSLNQFEEELTNKSIEM
jgi:hypothetical protein